MIHILLYENSKCIGGYKLKSSQYVCPREGEYIRYNEKEYRVTQVQHDYSNLESLNTLTIHIFCKNI